MHLNAEHALALAKDWPAYSDAELLAKATELAAGPRNAAWPFPEMPPLSKTPYHQPLPIGVDHPHWAIVSELPTENSDWRAGAPPRPHPYWPTKKTDEVYRQCEAYGLDRTALARRYSWGLLSPSDLTWMSEVLGGRGVVEIGAGSGYWAYVMAQYALNVVAYDPCMPGVGNGFCRGRGNRGELYHPVEFGDHQAAADHPDRALLLCWPSYQEPWAYEALRAYQGDMLIYCGEYAAACADDAFFQELDRHWEEIDHSGGHVTWSMLHCQLTAYQRRGEPHECDPAEVCAEQLGPLLREMDIEPGKILAELAAAGGA